MPLQIDEGRGASPPQPVEVAEGPTPVVITGVAETVVGGEETSPPRLVAMEAEDVESRVLGEPTTAVQESAAGALPGDPGG
jgi:hypothetical protein